MPSRTAAPQTHSQPSRKGKRAWRKNVDIAEIQTGIENAKQEETITGGKLLADVASETLFQTDSAGDIGVQRTYRRAHPNLKADEIIAARSAVPAVSSRKRAGELTNGIVDPSSKKRRSDGISRQQLLRLKNVAYGGTGVHKDVVRTDGSASHDPWAIVELVQDPAVSFVQKVQCIKVPSTLAEAPVSMMANGKTVPSVRKPIGGRSYNPDFKDWEALVDKEATKEIAAETKRLETAEMERIKQENIDAAAVEADRENNSEYESEWDGVQSDVDDAQLKRKRPERKTQVERNKIKRRKQAERLALHEKKMKDCAQQVRNIETIRAAVDANDLSRARALQKVKVVKDVEIMSSDEDEVLRRRTFGGRHVIPEAPLEIVLADELQDSLRRLKPEGNLLKDRFRNMLLQGKVEARRRITQPKKRMTQATVKWSYKDWKLPTRT